VKAEGTFDICLGATDAIFIGDDVVGDIDGVKV